MLKNKRQNKAYKIPKATVRNFMSIYGKGVCDFDLRSKEEFHYVEKHMV